MAAAHRSDGESDFKKRLAVAAKERSTWQDIVKQFAGCAEGKG
jgi:hypothetical protein